MGNLFSKKTDIPNTANEDLNTQLSVIKSANEDLKIDDNFKTELDTPKIDDAFNTLKQKHIKHHLEHLLIIMKQKINQKKNSSNAYIYLQDELKKIKRGQNFKTR